MIVRKKEGKMVKAYRLGENNPVLSALVTSGDIIETGNGMFEIFSQEAVSGSGEKAKLGDYVKIDSTGKPYPNSCEFFEKNHNWICGDEYEQIPVLRQAWNIEEKMCPEIEFLIKEKKLIINEQNEEKYFEAFLWGTRLTAPKDSFVVTYDVKKNMIGETTEIEFNFVRREEFYKNYKVLEKFNLPYQDK